MNTSGTIVIGNGEKCPYCELIIEENIDAFDHLYSNHKEELVEALFKEEK